MASSKRKQDEKNLKTLREIVSRPFNRQCFDCHQRGPTYANMTIGSFVCTACSGKLRGITPPHRVKSISMASFTPDEIDVLNVCGEELGFFFGGVLRTDGAGGGSEGSKVHCTIVLIRVLISRCMQFIKVI